MSCPRPTPFDGHAEAGQLTLCPGRQLVVLRPASTLQRGKPGGRGVDRGIGPALLATCRHGRGFLSGDEQNRLSIKSAPRLVRRVSSRNIGDYRLDPAPVSAKVSGLDTLGLVLPRLKIALGVLLAARRTRPRLLAARSQHFLGATKPLIVIEPLPPHPDPLGDLRHGHRRIGYPQR